jgi:hypothetical protein
MGYGRCRGERGPGPCRGENGPVDRFQRLTGARACAAGKDIVTVKLQRKSQLLTFKHLLAMLPAWVHRELGKIHHFLVNAKGRPCGLS